MAGLVATFEGDVEVAVVLGLEVDFKVELGVVDGGSIECFEEGVGDATAVDFIVDAAETDVIDEPRFSGGVRFAVEVEGVAEG